MRSTHFVETADEKRLRHAACLFGDIGWRSPPDYRSELALNLLANSATMALDHAGRAYLGLAVAYRHLGMDEEVNDPIRTLATPLLMDRARILGAIQRVAYIISASMPDVLPRTEMVCSKAKVVLTMPADLAPLVSDRLNARLKQLAKLIGRSPSIVIAN